MSGEQENFGFFIDTGPADPQEFDVETVPEENAEENKKESKKQKKLEEKERILGMKQSEKEAKLRKMKEHEKSLASFLFGKKDIEKDSNKSKSKDEVESESSSSDEESDLDEADLDQDDVEPDSGDEGEDAAEAEAPADSDHDEDDQKAKEKPDDAIKDLIPDDVFSKNLKSRKKSKKRKAAWEDEADEDLLVKDVTATYRKAKGKHGAKETSTEQYKKSLEKKFKSVVGEPAWASLDRKAKEGKDSDDSDDEFFRETTDLLERGKKKLKRGNLDQLAPGILEFRRLKDLNDASRAEGTVVKATEFHPSSTVGLVGGLNGTVSLFQVDGKSNPKIQTVNFQNFPVKTAKFSPNGQEFIVGSQHHSHFHTYDMMAGKISKSRWPKAVGEPFNSQMFEISPDGRLIAFKGRLGSIHLFSGRSKEYLRSLKMNNSCEALKFSKTGDQLFSHGEGGEVYIWDLRSSTCSTKFADDGCIDGSALAVNSSYLATGSSEGVVNIYSLNSLRSGTTKPKPEKVILNLSTQINQLSFSPGGEMLAISSELKDTAVRLVHFPSMTVFSNFPSNQTNLNKINSLGWSPAGGYFSMGNNRGCALLYRMKHFTEY